MDQSTKGQLPFTGERFIPTEKGRIAYEHYHRYVACLDAAAGKTVLDIACGEGFGSALLASRAKKVTGVDIDPATIHHATEKYRHIPNATFVIGDGRAIPLAAKSVDLIVSFETIEHIEEHEQVLKEFLRVLRPNGGIIISSPDKENYSEKPGYTNPHHVHELTHEQFVRIFREKFRFVRVYRQRLGIASFVIADNEKGPKLLHSFMAGKHGVEPGSQPLRGSLYSLVFCSNNKSTVRSIGSSVHLDPEDDLYLDQERVLRWASGLHGEHEVLRQQIQASNSALADAKKNSAELNEALKISAETLADLNRQNVDSERECRELRSALSRQASESQRLQTELWQRSAESQRLQTELSQQAGENQRLQTELSQQAAESDLLRTELWQQRAEVAAIRSSSSWRLTAPLRNIATTFGISHITKITPRSIWRTIRLQFYRRVRQHKNLASKTALIEKSGLFDQSWYLAQNPDVARSGANPLRHYLKYGAAEGRDPHPLFKGNMYLARYPDVANAGFNPLVHFLRFGAAEGREPHLSLGADWNRDSNYPPAPTEPLPPERKPSLANVDTSNLAAILKEEFGNECEHRVTSYLKIIATLQAFVARESSARREALAALAEHIKVLSAARNDQGPVTASIIIPAYNCIEYTIACVQSVLEHPTKHRYEIIIGNDFSTDETEKFFQAVGGIVRVATHRVNAGFVRNCNLSSKEARGRYVVFLNNDTFVLDGWLDALIDPFVTMGVGLVGSKLLMSNGRLQEAGGICWKDGSAWNFGRNQDPRLSEFNYLKDADYVSGASIAVPRDLWKEIGGFDERFAPAYCEDSDLAFTIRSKGLRTLYQPFSVVIHHEGVSHGTDVETGVKGYQIENTRKFFVKWQKVLAAEHFENGTKTFIARDRSARRPHILIVDHYLPEFDSDAGSRTIFQYTKMFADAGFHVTFWPENLLYKRRYAQALQSIGVEVLYGPRFGGQFQNWIKENGRYIKYVFLSRAHVAKNFVNHVRAHSSAKIIFYGHDLHMERLQKEFNISKSPDLKTEIAHWRQLEPLLWKASDVVYYPAHEECAFVKQMYRSKTVRQIPMYFYDIRQLEDARGLVAQRKNNMAPNLIFVGGFRHRPNEDGIIWFCTEVLPFIRKTVPSVLVKIIGSHPPREVQSLEAHDIQVTGFVSEERLTSLYRSSSVAIAPLRFGGGVKGKIIEAIRYGLPVVTTTTGLHGIDGGETFLKVADEPEGFAKAIIELLDDPELRRRLANRGLDFLAERYSQQAALNVLTLDFPELACGSRPTVI